MIHTLNLWDTDSNFDVYFKTIRLPFQPYVGLEMCMDGQNDKSENWEIEHLIYDLEKGEWNAFCKKPPFPYRFP